MRRESFRLEISNVGWLKRGEQPQRPTLTVRVSEQADALRERLSHGGHEPVGSGDVDVTFRFQGGTDEGEAHGVLAVAHRVTGEFLFELNAEAADVREFVAAARRYAEGTGDAARYRALVVADGEALADLKKRTLLVYGSDGALLRQHSLIPSGVEI